VYVGFPTFPAGFPDRLLHRLEELGSTMAFQRFGKIGWAAVVDLYSNPQTSSGCIAVQPAIPW
jgi:hypothetical protein